MIFCANCGIGEKNTRELEKILIKNRKEKIYAFIDGNNLYLAIKNYGWKLDFARFYIYLKDKYKVEKPFIFIGYLPGNEFSFTYND